MTYLLEISKTIYKNITMRNLPWKKIIMRTLWMILGVSTMVFFVMAWQEKDKKTIKDIQIQIEGEETQLFINERDCKGVVVDARRGDLVDGSGQSKTSKRLLRADRTTVR